ncbi:hypothetical protein EV715DRAFT_205098 [Schizophyllum commune]
MGQDWLILDLDARTKYRMGKLGESFFDVGRDVVQMLWVRPPLPQFSFEIKGVNKNNANAENNRSILSLPVELLDMIFALLEGDWSDLLCFAATCLTLWPIAATHLRRRFQRVQARRTSYGHRLVCLGDYTQADDLPPGLHLSEGERRESCGGDLYVFAYDHYASRGSIFGPDDGVVMSMIEALSRRPGYRDRDAQAIEGVLRRCLPREARFPRSDDGLVLRNLSEHAFVRGSALIAFNNGLPEHYEIMGRTQLPCLGNAALARICWSSSASIAMPYDGPLHRGVWAGDRFDIVQEEVFEREREAEPGKPWGDATDEVLAELKAMWIAEGLIIPL